MELLPGETNIFEITNSNVWQENQIGQLNTTIWSTIRLQPCLQLLSNQADNRSVLQISKSVVYNELPGKFGNTLRKDLDLNKALFPLELLQVGKREYTQLRQNLLSSEIHFLLIEKKQSIEILVN